MAYEREDIRKMNGYTSGEQPDDARTIKLNTNENPYPPSPRVAEAVRAIDTDTLRRYPPPTADTLRDRIAAHHAVQREQVVVTNGGDEALRLAITTFVNRGEAFGMATPSYSLYSVLAEVQGAQVVSIPMADDWLLPHDFAQRLNDRSARLTCIVNPHAPSGMLLDTEAIGRLANDIDGVLLVDEAYADFVDPAKRYDAVKLIDAFDNILFLRSFSKGYSLAGLRLGYLVGSVGLIDPILNKTRDSYNLNLIAQAAGLASFDDRSYAESTWAKVRQSRLVLHQELADLGFGIIPSETNFLLADVPASIRLSAADIYAQLKRADILVRYFDTPGMEHRLRITVGTPEENAALLSALTKLLV